MKASEWPYRDGVYRIAAERDRQYEIEGFRPDYDKLHYENGELIGAAIAYMFAARMFDRGEEEANATPPPMWPWEASWWKPTTRDRCLEKAGALIAAELDRATS